MLVRRAQIETFSSTAGNSYEDRVVLHLNRSFPNECESLGPAGVRKRIRDGIQKADKHGITSERDVCKYIDLMMVFGPDFDQDAWASSILTDRSLRDATVRLETLYESATQIQQGKNGGRRLG